ncbi:pseudouridine-5'-phosphate glycosidase [Stappia sp.]|uniref:pseudouridine-5'-phosphate glycosidase n=1 Tax=Stappia sp. TaxID=1870903 RepID=UPI003A9969AA
MQQNTAPQTGMPIAFGEEVEAARTAGRPLVALESTIITHGMPWPRNVETARLVEADIRAAGAVPATIAALDGSLHVGLSDARLEQLAKAEGVMKCSRADLAIALASGRPGSTTVAATMMAAHAAGIRVFATGGIGGVHRGAQTSFDISADLDELARTPVCVVAAGAKALLDLPKTLEVLETRGVPVIAYGSDTFPAFWSRDSGIAAPYRMDTAREIADLLDMRTRFGGHGGVLIANPVPAEAEIPPSQIAAAVDAAVGQAAREGVAGKDVTPFILSRIFESTSGRSLETNIALVRNNARLAAEIACALAERAATGIR